MPPDSSLSRGPQSERGRPMWLISWAICRKRSDSRQTMRTQASPRKRLTFPPRLEALEDRMLPSTYYAATASDLIADIKAANAAGGANTIVLTAPTTSPYILTAADNTTDGANGLPVISGGSSKVTADNLTILGNGDAIGRSSAPGTPAFRLFDVAGGAALTLENLSLGNGLAYGGGAAAQGGAVRNAGTLTLSQVTVGNNEALGLFYQSKNGKTVSAGDAAGGGIWSSGALMVENQSVIQRNTVIGAGTGSGYGGGIAVAGGTAKIDSSAIGASSPFSTYGGNTALGGYDPYTNAYASFGPGAGYGGGIYVGGGTVTLTNDVIKNNSAGSYIDMAFDGFNNLG